MDVERKLADSQVKRFALHGWVGLALIAVFWAINWLLPGLRTYWAFFPLWLGYCLTVDALVLYRSGTSLLTRSWSKYISLFLISAPVWWIFEAVNQRLQNWHYVGSEYFSFAAFVFWATLSFTTVIPAVFGTAELMTTFRFLDRFRHGPIIPPTLPVTLGFFIAGWVFFALMMIQPQVFFPLLWISLYFILEPINVWLGFRSLPDWLRRGDWRPVLALWCGVLVTAFFWEMWNYYA